MVSKILFSYKNKNEVPCWVLNDFQDIEESDIVKLHSDNTVYIISDTAPDDKMINVLTEGFAKVELIDDLDKDELNFEYSYVIVIGSEEIYKKAAKYVHRYTYVPVSFQDMIMNSVYGEVVCNPENEQYYMPDNIIICSQYMAQLDTGDYLEALAVALRLGIIRDASFYEWMILNFSEIMNREIEYISEIIYKSLSVMQFFVAKDLLKKNEYSFLDFGQCFGDALTKSITDLSVPDSLSLGMITASYIAYKREMISMEEFYEIRDMFVPFGLTISLDSFDVMSVYNNCILAGDDSNGYEMLLLKKIGKAVRVNDVKKEEILEAVRQLIVEWD